MPDQIDMRVAVTSILWGPAEDGYVMLSAQRETGERMVLAGRSVPAAARPGDELEVSGHWTEGKRGPVFAARSARRAMPKTAEGMRRWLEKAGVPGIGLVKAGRLVEAFGTATIDAVCDEDERATAIVGRKAMPKAAASIRERRREAEIGSTLSAHGIGIRTQKKILEQYGERTHDVLTGDPYRLIMDVDGIAFGTADKIARAAGLAGDAPSRIRAAIVDVLRNAARDGHCALHHPRLVDLCRQMLYVDERKIEAELDGLAPRHIARTEVRGQRAWADARIHRTEGELARHVARKLRDPAIHDFGRNAVEAAVAQAQANLGLTLSDEQAAGAAMALTERLSVLTGGPGTGKTHTLRVICEAWRLLASRIRVRREEQRGFRLGAPTGKAAKRITETTGFEGTTIHRMLEYKPETHSFERNASNPLDSGLICIDEASMPDVFIACDLARAWGEARVLLIGDTDQLPSVGPGKVLADLLGSGRVPHTRLTRIFRQAAGSDIAIGAEEVRHGRMPPVADPGRGDLVFVEATDPAVVAERIVRMYVERMPAYAAEHGLDPASIQILTPGHGHEVGTTALNREIQRRLHGEDPDKPVVTLSDRTTAGAGDRVIQLDNDYERNIYNGDTGQVVEVERDLEGKILSTHVSFSGAIHSFKGPTLQNLALSYALSIHKSQGSEFQIVIIPVTTQHFTLLRRTLLYTGMTRAKRLCVLVGSRRALRTAIEREDSSSRITTLRDAIVRECSEYDEDAADEIAERADA